MSQPVRISITLYDEDDNPMGWPISAFAELPVFAASVLGKDPGMGAGNAGGWNLWRKGWPKSVAAASPDESVESRARRWLDGHDKGTSSDTIRIWMLSAKVPYAARYPRDTADFGRCHRLLELIPEWRPRMAEMSAVPGWERLAGAWPELTAIYLEELPTGNAPKLYARIKELTDGPV